MHTLAFRLASHKHLHRYWMWLVWLSITTTVVLFVWGFGFIAAQAYPRQHLSPGMSLGGIYVGGMDDSEAMSRLESASLAQRETSFRLDGRVVSATYEEAGISFDLPGSYERAQYKQDHYRRDWSEFWRFWSLQNHELEVSLNDEKFESFVENRLREHENTRANADIELKNERVEIIPGTASRRINITSLKQRIMKDAANLEGSVSTPLETQAPRIQSHQIESVAEEVGQLLETEIVLTYDTREYEISREELVSWLSIKKDEEGWPEPALDKETATSYLKGLAEEIDVEPTPIRQTVHDGEIEDETEGENGRELDIDKNLAKLKESLFEQEEDIELELVVNPVVPIVNQDVSYSRSSRGIETLMSDYASQNYGDYGLKLISLSGDIEAGHNASESFVTASTYKAFLGYVAYRQIKDGKLDPGQSTGEGSVKTCMRVMLVASTNPCAIAIGRTIGWNKVDEVLHQEGMENTYLNNYSGNRRNKTTTAADAATLLNKIETGQGISDNQRTQMLGYLQTHNFRNGIPSGFSGSKVANKVGFLSPAIINDIAIIYGQKDTYILTAYSRGGTFPGLADLAGRLNRILE